MMNPSEFEYDKKPRLATVTITRQFKRSNRDTNEMIYKILQTIEEKDGASAFYLRTESGLGVGYYALEDFLKMLVNGMLIIDEGMKYQNKKVTAYKITDKGRQLISKYDIYFSMLPEVWRSEHQ